MKKETSSMKEYLRLKKLGEKSNEEKKAIEKQEITEFMKYFESNILDFKDSTLLKKLCEHIERVFKLEIEELGYKFDSVKNNKENTYELHFINDKNFPDKAVEYPGRGWNGENIVLKKPKIIFNIALLFKGLDNIDKEIRLRTCKEIFFTIFHEIQHERQDLMSMQKVSSNESLKYARDFACKLDILKKSWYTKNYDNYLIEKDANIVGLDKDLEIMQDNDRVFSTYRDIEKGKYYNGRYIADVWTSDQKTYYYSGLQERDVITEIILDDLICEQSMIGILELYPILQKEYNMDGSRKSVTELIDNMRKEIYDISGNTELSKIEKDELIKDAQEMYYELLYIQIQKSTQKEIEELVSKIGKKEFINILKRMIYYFLTQLQDYLNESVKLANLQEKKDRKRLSEDYVEKITILLELEAKYDVRMIKPIKNLLIKILKKLYLSDVFYNNALQRSLKGKKSAEEAIKRDENEIAEKNK